MVANVVSGKVKYPSDRLYRNGESRKVVFGTNQGDVTIWGDANDPVLVNARKDQTAQIEITGQDRHGKLVGKIVQIGSNGNYPPQAVNGNHNYNNGSNSHYQNQYQSNGIPPASGYQQQPPIASAAPPQDNKNVPDPFELDERANLYRRLYVHIWNELVNDEKMPQVSDDVRQKAVATIFIQTVRD